MDIGRTENPPLPLEERIVNYLQGIELEEARRALETRKKLSNLGLVVGPSCIEGWYWLVNLWPSDDPENRDAIRMAIEGSYAFLPEELQSHLRRERYLNPTLVDKKKK